MRRSDDLRLKDMLEYSRIAGNLASRTDFASFVINQHAQLALVKCVEIIGEAASGVSTEYRRRHSEIQWRGIISMRNRLVHVYWDIDLEEVWSASTIHAPFLSSQIEALGVTVE